MDAVHCECCLSASCTWHPQHRCMSACISEPWATYSKQLTSHELCIVCAGKWLVGGGVHLATAPPPPPGVGGIVVRRGGGGMDIGGRVASPQANIAAVQCMCLPLVGLFPEGKSGPTDHEASRRE